MSTKDWDHYCLHIDAAGLPLVDFAADGEVVINDPLLAQWDAEARANAGLGDAQ